jgi:uncharacterized protein YqhQ
MGGQAVLEGVMMRGADTWAVSVRRADGTIETKVEAIDATVTRRQAIPLVRGVLALAESLRLGYRALAWSANQQLLGEIAVDEAELARLDEFAPTPGGIDRSGRTRARDDRRAELQARIDEGKRAVESLSDRAVGASMVVALVVFAAVFLVVPALIGKGVHGRLGGVPFPVFEAVIRLGFFVGYVALISRIKEIRRVFEYHGAEHKAIAAYERGVELTPESADQFTTAHVRCGTNFLLTVMVIAIVTYSFVPTPNLWWVIGSRVVLIPLIAGVSYELIRAAARHFNRAWVRAAMRPGLLLQRLTTREPNLDQLEVAIASLRACMTVEQLADVDARAGIRTPQIRFA